VELVKSRRRKFSNGYSAYDQNFDINFGMAALK
jgi:hypothetical protein